MNICQFCQNELTTENTLNQNTCRNCGIPEPNAVEDATITIGTDEEESEPDTDMESILRSIRELQFVKFQMHQAGETDAIASKRCLSEILILMERCIDEAKLHAPVPSTVEQMKARQNLVKAIVYGMSFVANHPML